MRKSSRSLSIVAIHWQSGTGGCNQNGQIRKLERTSKRPLSWMNAILKLSWKYSRESHTALEDTVVEVCKNSWRCRLHFNTHHSWGALSLWETFSRWSQRTCLLCMKNYLRLRKVIFSAHKTKHGPTKDAENDLVRARNIFHMIEESSWAFGERGSLF